MQNKDTAEAPAPSVAPAKQASKPKSAGETELEDPVPSVPLRGLQDHSLGSLEAAFSQLHLQTPEGNANAKETGEEGAEDDPEGEHAPPYNASSGKRPSENAAGATEHPAASAPAAATLPAAHPATYSPTTTPAVAESTNLTGMPYGTNGVEPLATGPPMAHPVSEPVASCSSHVGIHQPAPCHESDAFRGAPVSVCPPTMPTYTMPEHGFTCMSGPESFGGQRGGSGR